jgi:hypothetical protein
LAKEDRPVDYFINNLEETLPPALPKGVKKESVIDETSIRTLTILGSDSTRSRNPRIEFPFRLWNAASAYQRLACDWLGIYALGHIC